MHYQVSNMILICCATVQEKTLGIIEIGNIAYTVIAALTFFLAFYVFVYQRKNDQKNKLELAEINNKNIKMQWFKELIIQPKINDVFVFYNNMRDIKFKITSSELSADEKIELINYIKLQHSTLRKSFLDLLQFIFSDLFRKLSTDLDNLIDNLTIAISDDELKLNNSKTYEREINLKIQNSYNFFLSSIVNYKG